MAGQPKSPRVLVHQDAKGHVRFYTSSFIPRLDLPHFKELEDMLDIVAENGYYYEDNGFVLGDTTRGDCRRFNLSAAAPHPHHGDLVQILFVRQDPKRCKCPGKIVGFAKEAVDCQSVKRKCKAGAEPRCDCEEGQSLVRGLLKQSKDHPTMRLSQYLCRRLEERCFYCFAATRVKRSRGGGNPCRTIKYESPVSSPASSDSGELLSAWSNSPTPSSPSSASSFGSNLTSSGESYECVSPFPLAERAVNYSPDDLAAPGPQEAPVRGHAEICQMMAEHIAQEEATMLQRNFEQAIPYGTENGSDAMDDGEFGRFLASDLAQATLHQLELEHALAKNQVLAKTQEIELPPIEEADYGMPTCTEYDPNVDLPDFAMNFD